MVKTMLGFFYIEYCVILPIFQFLRDGKSNGINDRDLYGTCKQYMLGETSKYPTVG